MASVVGVVERIKEEAWNQFSNRRGHGGRGLVLSLARHHCGLTLKHLGQLIGVMEGSAVSKAILRFEGRMKKDRKLAASYAQASSELSKVQL